MKMLQGLQRKCGNYVLVDGQSLTGHVSVNKHLKWLYECVANEGINDGFYKLLFVWCFCVVIVAATSVLYYQRECGNGVLAKKLIN